MSHRTRVATVLAAVLVGGMAVPAVAARPVAPDPDPVLADCYTDLYAATDWATYTSKRNPEQDENGLKWKIINSNTYYLKDQTTGAVQKMEEYRAKVVSLLAEHKVKSDDDLVVMADQTIACITAPAP